jgi:hypothetical protein
MRIIKKAPPDSNTKNTGAGSAEESNSSPQTNSPSASVSNPQPETKNESPKPDLKHLRRHVTPSSNKRLKNNTGTPVSRGTLNSDGYNSDDETSTPTASLLGLIKSAQARVRQPAIFPEFSKRSHFSLLYHSLPLAYFSKMSLSFSQTHVFGLFSRVICSSQLE